MKLNGPFTAAVSAALLMACNGASAFELRAHWALPGPVRWDYLALDSSATHLYVTRDTQVDVLDPRDGRVIATIADTHGAHGVALAEDSGRGYISNGKSDTVTLVDLQTFKPLREVSVGGHNPDAIVYEASHQHVFTFNGASHDVSVLSSSDLHLLTVFPVSGKPEFAVTDEQGRLFANIESEPGQVAVIDANQLKVIATWTLPGCNNPTGLSIDRHHQRLFSVCENKVMVITDAGSGKQVARVAIGGGPDAVAYDPQRALVISSNGEGTLTVAHQDDADHYRVVQTVPTQPGSRTLAVAPATGAVYLSSAAFQAESAPRQGHPAALAGSFAVLQVVP